MIIYKEFERINKSNEILIVPDNIKRRVITIKTNYELNNNKLLLFKVMSESELLEKLTFKILPEFILNEHEISKTPFSIIKEQIKFMQYDYLNKNNNLNTILNRNKEYIVESTFKDNFKKYHLNFISEPIYLKNMLEHHNINYSILNIKNSNTPLVYSFNYEIDEFYYVLNEITKLLDSGVDINKIYIAGISEKSIYRFNNLVKQFKIPFNLNIKSSYLEFKYTKDLLKKDLSSILTVIKEPSYNEIKQMINHEFINLFNKYPLNKYHEDTLLKIIKEDLKYKYYQEIIYENAINLISYDEIPFLNDDDIVFMLNARFDNLPTKTKDNEYLSDKEKINIGYPPSIIVNEYLTKEANKVLLSPAIKYISYSLKDDYDIYSPSLLLKDFKIEEKKLLFEDVSNYYAKEAYKIYFSDNHYEELLTTFDNSFSMNEEELNIVKKDIPKKVKKLTPSKLIKYIKSPFIFYLEEILKINMFETIIPILIGNFFHDLMECLLHINFDEKTNITHQSFNKNPKQGIIDDFIIENEGKEFDEDLLNNFISLYFKEELIEINHIKERLSKNSYLSVKEIELIKIIFFINRNKPFFIKSGNLLIDLENEKPSEKIFVEHSETFNNLNGRVDLVKIFTKDNEKYFDLIDYKSGIKGTLSVENIFNLFDDIKTNSQIDSSLLDSLQLIFYTYILMTRDNMKLNYFSFFTFLNIKPKLNGTYSESFNNLSRYFTYNVKRKLLNEDILKLNLEMKNLIDKVLTNINEGNFTNEVIQTKERRDSFEQTHFYKYQAIAYYGVDDLDFDEVDDE